MDLDSFWAVGVGDAKCIGPSLTLRMTIAKKFYSSESSGTSTGSVAGTFFL
jgi:hypothetical protein